jgi:hypothetical protein
MEITNLTHVRLAIGEGDRDCQFLSALAASRGIASFQFGNVLGNSTFSLLRKLKILPRYDQISTMLIFGDNDERAGKSLAVIRQGLNDADLASPPRPLEIARKRDGPPVAVVMMPFPDVDGNTEGCLETLLIPAIRRAHPAETACARTMFTCVGADRWRAKSFRDKLLVRTILSASCENNPMCGHPEWYRANPPLIPLGDPVFDGLAQLLTHAPAWFDSGLDKWKDWKAANIP